MHELLIQPLCTANCFDPNLYSLFKILNINISIAFGNTNSQEQKPEPCSQKFNFFHKLKNQHTIQNIHIVLSPLFSLNNQSNITRQQITYQLNLVKSAKHFLPTHSLFLTLIQSGVSQILNTHKTQFINIFFSYKFQTK